MDAKALQENLQSFGFTPSLVKLEMEMEIGRQKAAHKMTERNESGCVAGEETPQREEVG